MDDALQVHEVPFETLVQETSSGLVEPCDLVIRDQKTWDELWPRVTTCRVPDPAVPREWPVDPKTKWVPPPSPEVDWSAGMVVLVALGFRPTMGYDLEIDRIGVRGSVLMVHAVETEPGDLTFEMVSHPVHAVTTPPFEGEVEVTIDVRQGETGDCGLRDD